jgi:phosphatidylethanolamine-binding protein (PEBP) family uncharacterized protein
MNCTAAPEYPSCAKADIQMKPSVSWQKPQPGVNYTFVCWDPDAPAKAWLHWLVTNCTDSVTSGQTVVDWMPPTPPSGEHRYIFAILKQSKPITVPAPSQRGHFKLYAFLKKHDLTIASMVGIKVKA